MMKIKLITLSLFCFLCCLYCKNYYEILNVPNDADLKAIKQAFKKLSLKYHPDKSVQKSKKIEEKYLEIVNAYETLKNPQKRKKYDKEQRIRHNFKKEKNNNFDRRNSSNKKYKYDYFHDDNFENDYKWSKPQRDIFADSDILKLNFSTMKQFTQRKEVWILYFYDPNEKEDPQLKETFLKFYKLYSDLVKIAAVNCNKDQKICFDDFNMDSLPYIKGFSENKTTRGLSFNKKLTVNNLAHFANFLTKNIIARIEMSYYESFIRIHPDKFKILVFSNKNYPTFLLKSLALSLSQKMKFGMVDDQETELIKKFDVNVIPSLVLISDPARFEGIKYEGELKKKRIIEFLEKNARGIPIKIKPFARNILHLSKDAVEKGFCGENYDYLCFVLITSRMSEKQSLFLKKLSEYYEHDPINFFFVNSNEINYEMLFPHIKSLPTCIIIKGNQSKYVHLENFNFDQEIINDFIEKLLNGQVNKFLINGSLKNGFKYKYQKKTEL